MVHSRQGLLCHWQKEKEYEQERCPPTEKEKICDRSRVLMTECRGEKNTSTSRFRDKYQNYSDARILAPGESPSSDCIASRQACSCLPEPPFATYTSDKYLGETGNAFAHTRPCARTVISRCQCNCFAARSNPDTLSRRTTCYMRSRETISECRSCANSTVRTERRNRTARTIHQQFCSCNLEVQLQHLPPRVSQGCVSLRTRIPDLFLKNIRTRLKSPASRKLMSMVTKSVFVILLLTLAWTPCTCAGFAGSRQPLDRGQSHGPPRPNVFRGRLRKYEQCESITVPVCKDIGYNETNMSLSIVNKHTQAEAKEELDLFSPLLDVNCSTELKLLLCSIYTPICMRGYGRFLPPCRFVCERARHGCLPMLERYGFEWPKNLRCNQFPRYTGQNQMCMHFNLTKTSSNRDEKSGAAGGARRAGKFNSKKQASKSTTPSTTTTSTTISSTAVSKTTTNAANEKDCDTNPTKNVKPPGNEEPPAYSTATRPARRNDTSCVCRKPMVLLTDRRDSLYNKVTTGGVPNCAVSCFSPYFTEDQRSTAELWIKSWSIVCFVVTLMTVSTFLIDMERFKYPERPIIFLSTCYMFVSIGFLIRIIAGHEAVACAPRTDHILYHTTGPLLCTGVFLLVYFFSMASALWWVILTMTWFLAAGLKWGSEAISSYSQYYHAAAWLIPSLKSIMVLAMSSVDGDPLSGICLVGNQDVRALRGFIIAPLVVYLALGGMFLLAGFISLFRIRRSIKKDGTKTDKLERLMGRIGVFSVLYMVPAAVLVACYFYEQQYRPVWENIHNCQMANGEGSHIFKYEHSNDESRGDEYDDVMRNGTAAPEFAVFMMRYLMTLLIGITNGVWICSPKTVASWKRFYRRFICCLCGVPCKPAWKDAAKAPNKTPISDIPGHTKSLPRKPQKSNAPKVGNNFVTDDDVPRAKDLSGRNDSISSRLHKSEDSSIVTRSSSRIVSNRRSGSLSAKTSSESSQRGRCMACEMGERSARKGSRKHRSRNRNKSGSTDRSGEITKLSSDACECRVRHLPGAGENVRAALARTPVSARGVGRELMPSTDKARSRRDSNSDHCHGTLHRKTSTTFSECGPHMCDENCPLRGTCDRANKSRYIINDYDGGMNCRRGPPSLVNCEYPISSLPASESDGEESLVALLTKTPSVDLPSPTHFPFQHHNHFHHHHYLGNDEIQ